MSASIEKRMDRARRWLQQRRPRSASRILRGILRDDPSHLDALVLLSKLALAERHYGRASELLRRAVDLRPRNGVLHMRLGIAYQGLGRIDEAIAHLKRARQLRRDDGLVHFHLGVAQAAKGRINDAAHSYQRAIHYRPKFVSAHYQLADLLARAGAVNAAVAAYQKVLELQPRRDDAFVDLGNALRRCNKEAIAVRCYQRALELNPRSISALNNLSNVLRDQKRPKLAEKLMRRAVFLAPENPLLHNGLGLALEQLGQADEAFSCYGKALELRPEYANAHYNLGGLLYERGDYEQAAACYRRAIELDPDKPEAHYRLACLWLLKGDFAPAWPKYEQRWKLAEARKTVRQFERPAWQGEPLNGKTLLLVAEQGLGDTLQFVRYAKLVKERGAHVLLACPRRLRRMLASCPGVDAVVDQDAADKSQFDVFASLLSLPGLFQTSLDTIPNDVPYLFPEADIVDSWRPRIEALGGLRVGIAWQGKTSYMRDSTRSIPLAYFEPLTKIPGVQLLSLQKGDGRHQLNNHCADGAVYDLASELDGGDDAFIDTAAVMKHLDLVITSDTSIAHLAGGLGVPVWVALSYAPEWRWLLSRDDSPWYPTMKLFRQPRVNDWKSTFELIEESLRRMAAAAPAVDRPPSM
jgi:tetratricopeptide (TPR) repeat protein